MEAVTKIKIKKAERSRLSEVDFDNIPFGRVFSDHMLVANYRDGKWEDIEIRPYDKINVAPSISALHYGQSIFEGMKAQKGPDGEPLLFRAKDNWKRLNASADRLCMPPIPEDIFMDGLKELVRLDKEWIPTNEGSALYIRPFYFATDEYVGIKPSDTYKFIIFTCPVGAYYPEPVNLMVTDKYVRACAGGTGEAKAAGNYAASLKGAQEAKAEGYHNVLWLDGIEKKYIEECGTMNIFFIMDGKAVTPSLSGTILRGITRDSIITLLKDMGLEVEERRLTIDEIVSAYDAGKLTECFGTGTAATIAHVHKIGYKGRDLVFPPVDERKVGPALLQRLTDLRTGLAEDKHGWVEHI